MARTTPLYPIHQQLRARMIEFAGWLMPLQYTSILEEHRAVRQAAGLFDVSHLGRIVIAGPDALTLVQQLTTNDAARLQPGQAQYSLLLRPDGGILDDIYVYRRAEDFLLVVNAATTEKDLRWIQAHATGRVTITDQTADLATLSLQGPLSRDWLQPLCPVDLRPLRRNQHLETTVAGIPVLLARTGYTGERGYELFPPANQAVSLWQALLAHQPALKPCGLGARDTLRLEAGNRLYGQDMDETTNPFEAGLEWVVRLDKGDFLGRAALLQIQATGVRRRLVGFVLLDPGVPRHGCPVVWQGREVGVVTSGGYAPSLDQYIGFAYVPPDLSAVGSEFAVLIRGRPHRARVVETPFYRPRRPAEG